ncbi:hypothetical protein QBC36DRAFT_313773 [Triangularia setosa]|uniref:Uncharacterized protein n=1 Tax=Triangularia setosa TaxID=2587417 RepID=A0AAN6W1S5_9PEZI|nr:hypothetical protein QBC36DRAFT_313773 [Podospora setosa]
MASKRRPKDRYKGEAVYINMLIEMKEARGVIAADTTGGEVYQQFSISCHGWPASGRVPPQLDTRTLGAAAAPSHSVHGKGAVSCTGQKLRVGWANSPRHRLHSRQILERLHPCKRGPGCTLVASNIHHSTHSAHASLVPSHPVTLTFLSTLTIAPPPSPPSSANLTSLFLTVRPLVSPIPSPALLILLHCGILCPDWRQLVLLFPSSDHCSFLACALGHLERLGWFGLSARGTIDFQVGGCDALSWPTPLVAYIPPVPFHPFHSPSFKTGTVPLLQSNSLIPLSRRKHQACVYS